MGWRVVRQPNGRYAVFSSIVDNFTDGNLTRGEAIHECVERAGRDVANRKLSAANDHPEWWDEALETIRRIHGDAEAKRVAALLNVERDDA